MCCFCSGCLTHKISRQSKRRQRTKCTDFRMICDVFEVIVGAWPCFFLRKSLLLRVSEAKQLKREFFKNMFLCIYVFVKLWFPLPSFLLFSPHLPLHQSPPSLFTLFLNLPLFSRLSAGSLSRSAHPHAQTKGLWGSKNSSLYSNPVCANPL